MSSDLLVLMIIVGVVLVYVSVLMFINLTSQGVPTRRVYGVLVELWITFLLIIAILAYITATLGPVPSGSLAKELQNRLAHWNQLTGVQQGVILVGTLLALLLFAHVFWSIRAVQQHATRRAIPPADGGNTE